MCFSRTRIAIKTKPERKWNRRHIEPNKILRRSNSNKHSVHTLIVELLVGTSTPSICVRVFRLCLEYTGGKTMSSKFVIDASKTLVAKRFLVSLLKYAFVGRTKLD